MEIVIGDQDEYFSMTSARQTIRALVAKNIPASLVINPGQHHGFNVLSAPGITDQCWDFLKDKALDAEPLYQDYGL